MKITLDKFKAALEDSGAIKLVLAQRLDVSRWGLDLWLKKHPEVLKLMEAEAESMIDRAEYHLLKNLNHGDWKAVQHVLNSHKARNRGWAEKPIQVVGNQINVENIHDLIQLSKSKKWEEDNE